MKYQIKIPKPCSENWDKMTPTQQGALCSRCNKEVFDFTKTSDYELAKRITSHKSFCGKFRLDQLNTDISSLENSRFSKLGLLLGISTLLSFSTPLFAQKKTKKTEKTVQVTKSAQKTIGQSRHKDSIKAKGKMSHNNKEAIPNVRVITKGYSFDEDFPVAINATDTIVKCNDDYSTIKQVEAVLPGVALGVVVVKKQNIFRRIGNLFRKNDKKNESTAGIE